MDGAQADGASHRTGSAEETFAFERGVLKLITRDMPMPELLAELCRHAERLLGDGAICSILLLDADGQRIRVGSAPTLADRNRRHFDGAQAGAQHSPPATAIREHRTVAVEDLLADPAWADYASAAAKSGVRACWTTPLEDDAGGVIGALGLLTINWLVVRILFSSPKLTRLLQGHSTVLVKDGKIDKKALEHESLTHEELMEIIHRQGFESLHQVKRCELEPNGSFYVEAFEPSTADQQHAAVMARLDALAQEVASLRRQAAS